MAGAQLVPHKLPNGQTVMVPDYLLPKQQPALALPNVPAPPKGPDLRTADAGNSFLRQASPDYAKAMDAASTAPPPGPLAMTVAPPVEDAEARAKRQDAEKANAAAREHFGKPAAKNLKPVPKADPRRESSVIAQTASDLYGKKPGGPAAPPKADPQNLQPVVSKIQQERIPGQRLLREQEWRLGISERPDFPDEIDPDAQQPTIGTEEPIRRKYLTPLERGANQAGDAAVNEFKRQVEEQKLLGVAQQSALVQQSELLDSQLTTIADRRNRIAQLQETADRRMQEAESAEPRTRGEVWESKGALGQVIAMFGVALSAYGASLNRTGKNQSWEMINQVLNDEVEGERDRAERRFRVGRAAKNDVERAHALYGDLDAAMLESKNRKIANVMAVMQQQMANKALDETARVQGAAVYALAQEQYLANKQQLFDMITGKVTSEKVELEPYGKVVQSATPKPVGGGGGAAPGVSGDKLKGLSAEIRGLAVKMPDGTFKFVRNPVVRGDTQERLNSAKDMIHTIAQIQTLRADRSNAIPWSKKRGQMQALGSQLLLLDKSKNKMGTLDNGLLEFANKRFGSPEEFNVVDETLDGKMAENKAMLEDEVRRLAERELDNGPFELTEGGVSEDVVHD